MHVPPPRVQAEGCVQLLVQISRVQHLLDNLEEAVLLHELVVDQVDEAVLVVDVDDDFLRRTLLLVEACPLGLPEAEGFVLNKEASIQFDR